MLVFALRLARAVSCVHAALSLLVVALPPWYANWAWGLLLIVLTVIIHVIGLLLINEKVERIQADVVSRYSYSVVFVVIIGSTALLATLLHGIEAVIWAAAYLFVGLCQIPHLRCSTR
jgi:hypothetical protein